jgi:hypothetical protein
VTFESGKEEPSGTTAVGRAAGQFVDASGLPHYLFLLALGVGLLTPYLARLPNVPIRGWEWFTNYFVGFGGTMFFSAFNLIPAVTLFAFGKASKRAPTAFWFALAAAVGFLLWAHGSIDLRSSSTAALGLIFIPVWAVGAVVAGWVVGRLVHTAIRSESGRKWMSCLAVVIAVLLGVFASVEDSVSVAKREARFPFVAVQEVKLTKRVVYPCCDIGRVEVLALGEFDAEPGDDLMLLGAQGAAVLDRHSYAVKSRRAFHHAPCEGCVHMYPQLVPLGRGGFLVATSDGVSDGAGRLVWANKAAGFSKVVPVRVATGRHGFIAYDNLDHIDFHGDDGKVLWTATLPVSTVGVYRTPDGEEQPFAVSHVGQSREVRVFDVHGVLQTKVALPEWAANVESIGWPSKGNLLIGSGAWFGVVEPSGREVLTHRIEGTSFRPYHGPEGTSVRFDADAPPYLAVLGHGSSGYARSVLMLFDPNGRLVWQEEVNKLRTIQAVPRRDGTGEVLLVGGTDGVTEYALANAAINGTKADPGPRPN